MKTQIALLCFLFVACGNKETPKTIPVTKTPETKTPDNKAPDSTNTNSDSKPTDPVPAAAEWPPAGYQSLAKPMETPAKGTPGWVELPSLAKHKAMEAVSPQQPLLNGTFDDEGMFYTDGKVVGGAATKECAKDKEMYLNVSKVTMTPTLPAMAPDNIILFLCEGKNPVEGRDSIIVPK